MSRVRERPHSGIEFEVIVGRESDYRRAKRIFDKAKHPTFIGPGMVAQLARNGGLLFFVVDSIDSAVALVNTRQCSLQALSVIPSMRGNGLGGAVVRFLKTNFARVTETAVPWFERQGYQSIGKLKSGRSLKTQVMVKATLIPLAGRLRAILGKEQHHAGADDQTTLGLGDHSGTQDAGESILAPAGGADRPAHSHSRRRRAGRGRNRMDRARNRTASPHNTGEWRYCGHRANCGSDRGGSIAMVLRSTGLEIG